MRVEVTAADIEAGERNDCFRCPVALAVARAFRCDVIPAHVYEGMDGVYVEVHGRHQRAPQQVTDFVWAFDSGDGPGPFAFDLPDVADETWREECSGCQELFSPDDLNGDGLCGGCH